MNHAPVVLKELALKNVRCFEQLNLKFKSRPRKQGQWTILLGDNGVGKSTILKSLVITLSPLSDLAHYPEGRLQRFGVEPGNVTLDDNLNGVRTYELEKSRYTYNNESSYAVYAYGAARGSALGGPDRGVDLDHPLGSISTLFNQPPGLIHAETWLTKLAFAALESKGGADEGFYNAVTATLLALLPGIEQIEITSSEVVVKGAGVGRATLNTLSDGYITTVGWVCDLLARWSENARRHGLPLDGDFRDKMTGLVLVDELDLHLHPRWQRRVISDLRKTFPRMSFVGTTHNPLTLLGANKGEIQVLERNEEGVITVTQLDLPPGISTDGALTGGWFGLTTTLDDGTWRMLATYQRKVSRGATREEVRNDEKELRKRLPEFAVTQEDRIIRQLISENFDDNPMTERELRILKREMQARLRG